MFSVAYYNNEEVYIGYTLQVVLRGGTKNERSC
nr:MAG TPA: hypothetical protein [Caudoviricetes sp.]